ncbi:MAG: hypothetical protein A4S09_00915 [Proteobacteria bacterium SG_bin7]|nr:MAG: hypothetical protein A4S09_00915 [Proteobacteria bacterium SG_bin7]
MFFVLSLISQLVFAASPIPGNCNYYLEKEKDTGCFVKEQNPSDYLLNFGYRLCHIYHQKAKTWNDERTAFVEKVGMCLQEEMEKILFNGNCQDLEEKAYASHPGCYIRSGYCELNVVQKSSIVWTAVAADALSKTGNKSAYYWFQLLRDCNGKSTSVADQLP